MQTLELRTLETAKGKSVTTPLTDAQALTICRGLTKPFAKDLASKADQYGLTHDQIVWTHILAIEGTFEHVKKTVEQTIQDFENIAAFFKRASANLKYPKVLLYVVDRCIVLKWKLDGTIQLVDRHRTTFNQKFGKPMPEWYGKITPDGKLVTGVELLGLHEALTAFAQNHTHVAEVYGQRFGHCCFCGLELTNKASVHLGYGPICASNYGLPWEVE